jgi:hypothetical protein
VCTQVGWVTVGLATGAARCARRRTRPWRPFAPRFDVCTQVGWATVGLATEAALCVRRRTRPWPPFAPGSDVRTHVVWVTVGLPTDAANRCTLADRNSRASTPGFDVVSQPLRGTIRLATRTTRIGRRREDVRHAPWHMKVMRVDPYPPGPPPRVVYIYHFRKGLYLEGLRPTAPSIARA